MPNWCEGTLKVRGEIKNVEKWVRECVSIRHPKYNINFVVQIDVVSDGIFVDAGEEEISVEVTEMAYIKGTYRCFVQKGMYGATGDKNIIVLCMKFQAAWIINPEEFINMSKKYDIDFRLYGCERGNEFCQEVIVENGMLTKDQKIRYDNYSWECPFPLLGG